MIGRFVSLCRNLGLIFLIRDCCGVFERGYEHGEEARVALRAKPALKSDEAFLRLVERAKQLRDSTVDSVGAPVKLDARILSAHPVAALVLCSWAWVLLVESSVLASPLLREVAAGSGATDPRDWNAESTDDARGDR